MLYTFIFSSPILDLCPWALIFSPIYKRVARVQINVQPKGPRTYFSALGARVPIWFDIVYLYLCTYVYIIIIYI